MGLTLEEARELREQTLREKKNQRKDRVNEIVAKSLSLEKVEELLRELIIHNAEQRCFAVKVLNVVTNDWNSPDRDKIREEVQIELEKKYETAFLGCEISEFNVGNNSIAFHLTMRL